MIKIKKEKSLLKHGLCSKNLNLAEKKSIVQAEQALINAIDPMMCLNYYSNFPFKNF